MHDIQLPLFFDMPVAKSISKVAEKAKWQLAVKGVKELFTIHDAGYYYNHLSKYFPKVDIWITDYYHVMESQTAILEMIRTTGLKPYLERINSDEEKREFETLVLKEIEQDYPSQDNGKVLFPFKRLFFMTKK